MGGSLATRMKCLAALYADSAISVHVHEAAGRVFAGLSFVEGHDGRPWKAPFGNRSTVLQTDVGMPCRCEKD